MRLWRGGERFPPTRQPAPPQVAAPHGQLRSIRRLARLVHRRKVLVAVRGDDDARMNLHLRLALAAQLQAIELRDDITAVGKLVGGRVVVERMGRARPSFVVARHAQEDVSGAVHAGRAPDRVFTPEVLPFQYANGGRDAGVLTGHPRGCLAWRSRRDDRNNRDNPDHEHRSHGWYAHMTPVRSR